MKSSSIIRFTLVISLFLFNVFNIAAQTINDVDTVWTNIVPMRSAHVKTILLKNGNYLAYGFNSYAAGLVGHNNITGSNKNEIYLAEFTESGVLLRYKTIPVNVPETENRRYITHPRLVERNDGGLLILSEFEHGGGEGTLAINTLTNPYRLWRIITDANWVIKWEGVHGMQFNNYSYGGNTYNWIIGIRIFDYQRIDNTTIAAAFTGVMSLNGVRDVVNRAKGVVYIDDDANPKTNALKLFSVSNPSTATDIRRTSTNRFIFSGDMPEVYISSDLNCTSFSSFATLPVCTVCPTTHFYAKPAPIYLPNIDAYTMQGLTGNMNAPYNNSKFQSAAWKWTNSLAVESPAPKWYGDHKITGVPILLNPSGVAYDRIFNTIRTCNVGGVLNSCGKNRIAEFIYSNTGAITVNEGNYLNTTANTDYGFTILSKNNDGIMVGGVTTSGERRMVVGKLSLCSNYKLNEINDTLLYSGSALSSKNIVSTGKFAGATETFGWTITLIEGSLSSHPLATVGTVIAQGSSASIPPAIFTVDKNSKAKLLVECNAKQSYGTPVQYCSSIQSFTIDVIPYLSSTLFSDDVWLFGLNEGIPQGNGGNILGTDKTSKGIIFKKENGVYKAYDYSKISKVNSWENSLSVSTPACNGSFIFYTQHNHVFNSEHKPMKGGVASNPITDPGYFEGHTSTSDGLAAAYLGDNKYILVSVSTAGWGNLNYYIIDMSKDNGLGEMFQGGVIDNTGQVSEGIELMPMAGTYNQYWLAYYNRQSNQVKIAKIDGANPSTPVITNHMALSMSAYITNSMLDYNGLIYGFKASNSYSTLAMAHPFVGTGISLTHNHVKLFKFNPLTGVLAFDKQFSAGLNGDVYSLAYSQNGKFLYVGIAGRGDGSCDGYVLQYNLETSTVEGHKVYQEKSTTIGYSGGGLKMGPDGKIYVMRQSSDYMAVIPNPDLSFNAGGTLVVNGFKLSVKGAGLQISTGLTPPWINPPSSNTAPVVDDDAMTGTQFDTIRVKPLLNDTDDGGMANLNLSGVNFVTATDAALGNLVWSAATKEVIFVPKSPYPIEKDTVIYLSYVTRDQGVPVAMCDEGRITVTIKYAKVNSKLFSDDVWFFGQNEGAARASDQLGTPKTSKGIVFKNESGVMVPYDYSGVSMVNSWENSLSVSTPACNGSFIFYTQHDKVFNANHEVMEGGTFKGHTSLADGLAACYIGNNKYILFSVGNQTGLDGLYYYFIDMNANNGLGKMTTGGAVETGLKADESIEIIPKVGTYDQYWLLYFDKTNAKLKVRLIDGSQANPIGGIVSQINYSYAATYPMQLTANTYYDRLLATFISGVFVIYDFNPATGLIKEKYAKSSIVSTYGGAFAPNGKYFYIGCYVNNNLIRQYDTEAGNLIGSSQFTPETVTCGSGMKLGPDGKMYIVREGHNWMATIEKPDLAFTAPGGGVTMNGFKLSRSGNGLRPSTGLTPPWLDPPTSNTAPTAINHSVTGNQYDSIKIKATLGATDAEGNTINLNGAGFVNTADAIKGTVIWKADTKEVIFIPDFTYNFTDGEKIKLWYGIKDNGVPVALCNEGEIEITINKTKVSSKIFSDDVWFFGQNKGADWLAGVSGIGKTSKGIIFENNGGVMVPRDASNISMVNSRENSLSVSTPACNGSFIFYASHNQVFNSLHEKMAGGDFDGHTSNSDGLAAAYIGNNKYILISVSTEGDVGQLKYYIINMGLQNGLGQMSTGGVIDNSNRVGEAIELIPKVGTYDEYWLIYYRSDSRKFIIYAVKGNNGSPTLTKVNEYASNLTPGLAHIYDIKSNGTYNVIAAIMSNQIALFSFSPLTGELVHRKTVVHTTALSSNLYSAEFSPNGKYLYLTDIWTTAGNYPQLLQYDISNLINPVYVNSVPYSHMATGVDVQFVGGSAKVGPDGKMYLVRSNVDQMAVVNNPNAPLTSTSVTLNGFQLQTIGSESLHISVGLTPPWIDPVLSSNDAPQARPDYAVSFKGLPVTIHPLSNDTDDGGQANLSITSVSFLNSADAAKGTYSLTSGTVVTFTPNASYSFANEEEIILNYIMKDKGVPIQQCDESQIKITIRKSPEIQLTDSCSFKPKLFIDFPISLKIGVDIFLQWEVSSNNVSWTTIAGAITTKLEVPATYLTANNYYRLKVTNSAGVTFYTSTKKLKIINTYILPGGIWYETSLGN